MRVRRRQKSAGWLIGHARQQAGLPADAPAGTKYGDEDWVRPPRAARCRWALGELVGVHGTKGGAHYSGLLACGSVSTCPMCSAVIRSERSREIQQAAGDWLRADGGLTFLSLTTRHRLKDPLRLTLEGITYAWQRIQSWRKYRKLMRKYRLIGTIKAAEVTYGESGWHPHFHLLMFWQRPLAYAEVAHIEALLSEWWVDAIEKFQDRYPMGLPTKERGVDMRQVRDGAGIGAYISKVQEKDAPAGRSRMGKVGNELARADLKSGRNGNRVPFELLDTEPSEKGYARDRALWLEYFDVMHGKHVTEWSPHLKKALLEKPEKTEAQIMAEAESQYDRLFNITKPRYEEIMNDPNLYAGVLEAIEYGDEEMSRRIVTDNGAQPDAVVEVVELEAEAPRAPLDDRRLLTPRRVARMEWADVVVAKQVQREMDSQPRSEPASR